MKNYNVMKGLFFTVCACLFIGLSGGASAQIISTIAGTGTGTYTADGVPATTSALFNPTTSAVDGAGNVYIADWGNHRVRRINTSGIISTIAGTGTAGGTGDGGPATAATLNLPNGVAFDAAGNLYVAEQAGHRIRKISTTGIITTIAGTGTSGYLGDGGPATAGRLNTPGNCVIDVAGNVYVADWGNSVIRKINTSGIISTVAGTGIGAYAGDGGPATAAQLNHPYSVSLDLSNNLYISDEYNNRLRRVNLTTGIISLVGGTGTAGSAGDGGPATAAEFFRPDGIVADAGSLWVADTRNNKIRRIVLSTGIVTTYAGTGTAGSTGDGGPATAALLNTPSGVVLDLSGNVYITDFNNHKVRMINRNNHVPKFDSGTGQRLILCRDAAATAINYLLPVTDSDASQTLTWILNTAPLHGTIHQTGTPVSTGGTMFTAASTGLSVSTTGLTYTPSTGYSGRDSFMVHVNDGISVDSIKITVNIMPFPVAVPIGGPSTVCVGSSITLTNDTTGGTWLSVTGNSTVSTGGVVTGVTAGPDTILYIITNSCGADTSSKIITVISGLPSITGPSAVCVAASITLSNSMPGGVWTSSTPSIATVGSASGIVTGVSTGVDTIYYTVGSCSTFTLVTVSPSPAAIGGPGSVCMGATITLTNSVAGGTWTSGNTSVATIGSLSGIVSGVAVGSTSITYSLGASCTVMRGITVNLTPSVSPLTASVCVGGATVLTSPTSGGTWSSSATGTASVVGGTVSGVAAGVATISYTLGTGCFGTASVTVNALPAAITPSGAVSVCVGNTVSLSSTTSGGTWSSGTTSIATVGSTGVVSGVSIGVANITYTAGGCFVTKTVSVISAPAAISPASSVICTGASSTLTNSASGGVWTSSNTSIATIGSATGTLTGVAAGSVTITYSVGASCFVTATVTVNTSPAAILPSTPVTICVGSAVTLSSATSSGSWSSGSVSIASVSGSGVVSGVAVGTAVISYTVAGCSVTKTVTVAALPPAITPSSSAVCIGTTTTLTNATPGGTWTSSNTSVATVGAGTGVVSGITAGSVTITYTTGTCFVTATVTVNPLPSAITPATGVGICVGATATLADATPGGTWSSGSTAIATVGSSGTVTGIASGTATISYTVSGCAATKTVTVQVTPSAISPSSPVVCAGSSLILTNTVTGGTWSSGIPAVATIDGSGTATGISAGTSAITYAIGSCSVTATVTVNTTPAAILPSTPVILCAGGTASLSNGTPGGTWSSSNTAVATIGTSGTVTAITSGTATISYTNSLGCAAVKTITVSVTPAVITPSPASVCAGNTTGLTNSVGGGTWTSSNPSVAAIGSSTGIVTGVTSGTANITYSIGACQATSTVTVTPLPSAGTISGPSNLCTGSTGTLSTTATGGFWTSSNTSVATVGLFTGLVSAISSGTAIISYSVTGLCGTVSSVYTITVTPPGVSPIAGPSSVCAGTFTTYTDASPGGTWSVTNANATITSTGLLTGITPGLDTIRYTLTNVCGTSVATMTVNIGTFLSAGTISGPGTVCEGATIALTDPVPGGTWSSSNTSIATVGTSGVVTGTGGGIDTIMYTVTASCGSAIASKTVTVTAIPVAGTISGPSDICVGMIVTYTGPTPGGIWGITNPAIAAISGSGVVSALTTGLDTIRYTVTNTCGTAVSSKTVNVAAPLTAGTITGPSAVCAGATITLSNTVSGGTWSSSIPAAGTIDASGIVAGIAAGTTTISYTVSNSCGTVSTTKAVTVNPLPDAGTISGASLLCAGATTTYTTTGSGGTWSSSNPGVATIGSASGSATAIAAGTTTISYTASNTCGTTTATWALAVGSSSSATPITGPGAVCAGSAITLSNATPGGTWSSANPAIATVTTGGVVSGITTGTTTITYTVTGSCGTATATHTVIVSTAPSTAPISGPSAMCTGTFALFTNPIAGGTWGSGNPAIATISGAGLVTAIAPGTVTISYTTSTACGSLTATTNVTVATGATAGTISGPGSLCVATTAALTTTGGAGGTWSSSNPSAATVSSTGIVTAIAAGSTTITYTLTSSCGTTTATHTIAVVSGTGISPITGPSVVCVGSLIMLGNATPGGAWGASNGNATITTGGLVTGITPGIDTISYTISGACGLASVTKVITVNLLPTVGAISGPATVCAGASILLTNTTPGGVWSRTNSTASVGSATGIVTGITAGTDTIIYTVTTSCGSISTSTTITVNPLPNAGTITGPDSVCTGTSVTLSDAVPGGTWSAGNTNAAVSGTGIVTGLSNGTTPISYTVSNSCGTATAVKIVTIVSIPTAGGISGSSMVCAGSGITLTASSPGGTWSAANGNAIVAGPGIIHGVTVGLDTIFYTVSNICGSSVASKPITINPVPVVSPISGPTSHCVSTTITLSSATTGGVWNSSNPSVATIGISSGIVSGIAAGTTTVTYTVTNSFGCPTSVTAQDTVNILPVLPAISGSTGVCIGATTTLTDTITGGTWMSSNPVVAAIGITSGIVTGMTAGTTTITYTITNSCGTTFTTRTQTVHPLPVVAPVTGTTHQCTGASTTLASATTGGIWTSSNPAIATIGSSSGIVIGITPGTTTINYVYTGAFGCTSVTFVQDTVVAAPVVAGITGTTHHCVGATTTLSNATPGGTWSSATPAVATVGATTGIVTGVTAGTAIINYSVTNTAGCTTTVSISDTVTTTPTVDTISGPGSVCAGGMITLTNSTAGGTWSMTNSNATIGGTGIVTGLTAGLDTAVYTVSNSCGSATATKTITIIGPPTVGAITGATNVCAGTTITLSNATSGGVWSASNGNAAISTGGVVTGITPGMDTIRYTVTTTCGSATVSTVITIGTLPTVGAISGAGTVCKDAAIILTNATTGGVWTATNGKVTVSSAGVVTGGTAGMDTVRYTVTNACGSAVAIKAISVIQPPSAGAVSGAGSVCPGRTITLSASTPGGTWSSSNTAKATVSSAGVVTGITPGTATINYTVSNSCGSRTATKVITVLTPAECGGGTHTQVSVPVAEAIRLYPNPANAVLHIEAPVKVNITIVTVDGKTVLTQQDAGQVDISGLADGFYLVKIYDEENNLLRTDKFIKMQ